MDPTTVLETLRRLTNRTFDGIGVPEPEEFAEAFQSLDGWITAGGFLPAQWPSNSTSDDDYPEYEDDGIGPECDDQNGMSEVDFLSEYQEDRGY